MVQQDFLVYLVEKQALGTGVVASAANETLFSVAPICDHIAIISPSSFDFHTLNSV